MGLMGPNVTLTSDLEVVSDLRIHYGASALLSTGQFTFALRSSLFWDVKQLGLVVSCRCFGTPYESQTACPLKMGRIGFPETSVTNCQSTMHNIPEERRYHYVPYLLILTYVCHQSLTDATSVHFRHFTVLSPRDNINIHRPLVQHCPAVTLPPSVFYPISSQECS
jgi:hypothetical protein